MAVEWTTAALVREALGNLTGKSGIPDAEIEEMIEQNEGFVETILKIESSFAFDSAKKPHKAIRKLVTLLTALSLMSKYAMSFTTLKYAKNFEYITWIEVNRLIKMLDVPGAVHFIRES